MDLLHLINIIGAVLVHPDLPEVLSYLRESHASRAASTNPCEEEVAFARKRVNEIDALLRDDNSADINPTDTVLTEAAYYLRWPDDIGCDTTIEAGNF